MASPPEKINNDKEVTSSDEAFKTTRNMKLQKMRLDNEDTDVILVCEECQFPAHKIILKVSCPYFDTMFKSSFKESKEPCIEINIEAEVMGRVLDYIYMVSPAVVEACANIGETVKLLEAAHYLGIIDLFHLCCYKVMDNAIPTDFPLLSTLQLYEDPIAEQVLEDFAAKYAEQIFKEDMHLTYDYMKFRILLDKTCYRIPPADIPFQEVMKWLKAHEGELCDFIADLFTLFHIHDLYEPFLASFSEAGIIESNPKILLEICKQPPLDLSTYRCPFDVKQNKEESELINSLTIYLFQNIEGRSVRWQRYFNKSMLETPQVMELPIQLSRSMKCFPYGQFIYFVEGEPHPDQQSFLVCHRYDPQSNSVQLLTGADTEVSGAIHDVVVVNNGAFVVEKWGRRGNSFKTDIDYFSLDSISESIWLQIEKKIEDPLCVNCGNKLMLICKTQDVNTVEMMEITETDMMGDSLTLNPPTTCFTFPFEFKHHQTITYDNKIYAFCNHLMYIFDPMSNTTQCVHSGILIEDSDVIYSLDQYKSTFYLVIRQDLTETEYSYKLWRVGSTEFSAEAIVEKGAALDAVSFMSHNA